MHAPEGYGSHFVIQSLCHSFTLSIADLKDSCFATSCVSYGSLPKFYFFCSGVTSEWKGKYYIVCEDKSFAKLLIIICILDMDEARHLHLSL